MYVFYCTFPHYEAWTDSLFLKIVNKQLCKSIKIFTISSAVCLQKMYKLMIKFGKNQFQQQCEFAKCSHFPNSFLSLFNVLRMQLLLAFIALAFMKPYDLLDLQSLILHSLSLHSLTSTFMKHYALLDLYKIRYLCMEYSDQNLNRPSKMSGFSILVKFE